MTTRSFEMRAVPALVMIASQFVFGTAYAQDRDQARGSGAAVVSAFEKYCFGQPYTVAEITAKLAGDAALSGIPFPADFPLKAMGEGQAWSLSIDGKPFQLIVLHRLGFKKSGIQCFLRTEEKKGTIFPYIDAFEERMNANGLKGRETDIPAYFRASGKVADGRNVDARLLTRSPWPTTTTVRYTSMVALYE